MKKLLKWVNERFVKMDIFDVALIKLCVASVVLFIITVSSTVMDLVVQVNPWIFLAAGIVFWIRPVYKTFFKK